MEVDTVKETDLTGNDQIVTQLIWLCREQISQTFGIRKKNNTEVVFHLIYAHCSLTCSLPSDSINQSS